MEFLTFFTAKSALNDVDVKKQILSDTTSRLNKELSEKENELEAVELNKEQTLSTLNR